MFKPDMPAAPTPQAAPEDPSQYWARKKAVLDVGGSPPTSGIMGARSTSGMGA